MNSIENKESFNNMQHISPTYQTDFVCTYNKIDDQEDSVILYQIQILQAFNLLEFNDNIINKITEDLYEKYKNNKYILKIIQHKFKIIKHKSNHTNNELDMFRLCFKYNTFHLMHSILCSLINNNEINQDNYKKLLSNSAL